MGQTQPLCNANEIIECAHSHGCWVSPKVFSHNDLLLAEHEQDASSIMAVDHGVQKSFTISSC